MPTALPNKDPGRSRQRTRDAFGGGWLLATLSVPAAVGVITAVVPAALVLPAASILLVTAGLALGAFTVLARGWPGGAGDRRLDIAGGLLLVGVGASMLTDVSEAMRSLAELQSSLPHRDR